MEYRSGRRRRLSPNFRFLILLFILTPIAVKPTPPTQPPYFEFNVHGFVESRAEGRKMGLPVALLVKRALDIPDSLNAFEVFIPRGKETDLGSKYFVFTNAQGEFILRVKSIDPLDSLSVAVMMADYALITGDTLAVDDLQGIEYETIVSNDDGGCCDDSGTTPVLTKIQYVVLDQAVVVP